MYKTKKNFISDLAVLLMMFSTIIILLIIVDAGDSYKAYEVAANADSE